MNRRRQSAWVVALAVITGMGAVLMTEFVLTLTSSQETPAQPRTGVTPNTAPTQPWETVP